MEIGFYRKIVLVVLASSVLMMSACATVKPDEAVSGKTGVMTQDASRNVAAETDVKLAKAADQTDTVNAAEQAKAVTQVSTDKADGQQNITAKISQKEKRAKIKSAASNKSRTIARLQGGKRIEILDEKGNWLKIRWQEKDKVREGWVNKQYIDMTP